VSNTIHKNSVVCNNSEDDILFNDTARLNASYKEKLRLNSTTIWLILSRGIIAVYCENDTKHINTSKFDVCCAVLRRNNWRMKTN